MTSPYVLADSTQFVHSSLLFSTILTYRGQLYLQRIYRGNWRKTKHPRAELKI